VNGFALYWRYMRINFLAQLQYKGWIFDFILALFFVATDPLDAALLLGRFGGVGGMSASQILLVYAMAVCAFGLAEIFGRGFDYFPFLVRGGEFDRIMLRPRSTAMQAAALRFHLSRFSRVLGMGAFAVFMLRAQDIAIGAREILLFIGALAGGTLVYTGIFIIAATVSFFTIQPLDVIYIFTNGSYQVAKVPPRLLPDWLRRAFTYIAPMFAFCYYPAASICGWGEADWPGYMALPAGAAFLVVSLAIWQFGVRHYKGTGS